MNFTKAYDTLAQMTRKTDLLPYALRVAEWNNVAMKARGGKQTELDLQFSFVKEEFNELCDALEVCDKKEVIDAACDLFVVASYALLIKTGRCGQFDRAMVPQKKFSLGDLSYNIHACEITAASLEHVLSDVVALCFTLDTNLAYNMEQVLDSNDSKYPTLRQMKAIYPDQGADIDLILTMEAKAIEKRSKGRYTGVVPVVSDEGATDDSRVVFFDSNGKIMKPSTFVEPKIIV